MQTPTHLQAAADEIRDLIARGLAQPGVQAAVEMMQLSMTMESDAAQIAQVYGPTVQTGASDSAHAG